MATPVKMPELGESITEGTITRWIKQEGDRVEADEPLFEVSTDKVDTEVPSPVAGVLKTIKVQADETVEVGAELAIIEQDGEASGESGGEDEAGGSAEAGSDTAEEAAEADEGSEEAGSEEERESEAAEAEAEGGDDEQAEEKPEAEEKPKAEASGDGGTTTVTMPELGESITEGTITRWLKEEGDQVKADEPLFEISTDKVDTEVPSPVSGVLQSIKVQADETVEVGAELAVIGGGGGGGSAGADTDQEQAKEETAEEGAGAEAEQAAEGEEQEQPKAEPAAEAKPAETGAEGDGKGNGKAAAGVS